MPDGFLFNFIMNMKKLLLFALLLVGMTGFAQRNEVIAKDTIAINRNQIELVLKNKNGKSYDIPKFRYYGSIRNTDKESVESFKNGSDKCYVIFNNYSSGERKISKIYVSK